jgi:hypothetical protein
MASSERLPTPADLRELATRAAQLAADIDAARVRLRAISGYAPTLGWQLDEDGAASVRRAVRGLTETAADLERVLVRQEPGRRNCTAQWGCCPHHGGTLSGTGGGWRCRTPGCGRAWDWNLGGLPCLEPAAFTVLDRDGKAMDLCAGHTIDAGKRLVGARVQSLRPAEEGSL